MGQCLITYITPLQNEKIDHRMLYDTKALLKKIANKICGSSKTDICDVVFLAFIWYYGKILNEIDKVYF